MVSLIEIKSQVMSAVAELLGCGRDDLYPPSLLVVGCSTSEVAGGIIGKAGQPETGEAVVEAALEAARAFNTDVAFQCCEHLNRALVLSGAVCEARGYERVSVVPYPEAGGACAAASYRMLKNPAVVERVVADAGLDIGQTLIGMHVRPVAIPVRLGVTKIGEAVVTAARARPKLIGGERARYKL